MHRITFSLGFLLILAAMTLRHFYPAPDIAGGAGAASETNAEPEQSEKSTASSGPNEAPTEPKSEKEPEPEVVPVKPPEVEAVLIKPSIPTDLFAPGLDEFEGEAVDLLRRRLNAYLARQDEVRALLSLERLLESGEKFDTEGRAQWKQLREAAPLWQPDPKERGSISLSIQIELPKDVSWEIDPTKAAWQKILLNSTGGQFMARLSVARREAGKNALLTLNSKVKVPIQMDGTRPLIEQALAQALQKAAKAPEREGATLSEALTRLEWKQLKKAL